MDLARFNCIWEMLGALMLNCLRHWRFKRMLSCIVVTAGRVEAVQIQVDAVKQDFSDSRVEVDSLIDHGFVLLMVTGTRLSFQSG